MPNVQELYNQLMSICSDLKDQIAFLESLASKMETTESVTSGVMNQTSRVDIQQAAVAYIHVAWNDTKEAAISLEEARKLLDLYANQL